MFFHIVAIFRLFILFSSEPIPKGDAKGKDNENTQEDIPASFGVPCGGEVFVPVFYYINSAIDSSSLFLGQT